MKVFVLAAGLSIALFGNGGAAAKEKTPALTPQQLNVLKHYAEATALAHHCPTMRLNESVAFIAMMGYGLTDPKVAPVARDAAAEIGLKAAKDTALLRGKTDEACAIAKLLYGPDGMNVQDFMIPR